MDTTGPRSTSALSPSLKWSLSVGVYTFVCATVLLLGLSQVAAVVADLLVLPSDSVVWLAGPVPVFGSLLWWRLVERGGADTYRRGAAVGLLTALLTAVFWVLRAGLVWGPEGIVAGWPLVVAMLVPTIPAGIVTGITVMYARRRLAGTRSTAGY